MGGITAKRRGCGRGNTEDKDVGKEEDEDQKVGCCH